MRAGFLRLAFLLSSGLLGWTAPLVGQETTTEQANATPSLTLPKAWVDTVDWRSIGPANMSGRIVGLASNAQDPTQWWAASASGGLLKTSNNGMTFEHQFDSEATVSIGAFDVSKTNPEIIWVGTGEENPRNSSSWGDGVYKSVDGGATWENMGLNKIFQTGAVLIHPTNPEVVFVGALGRLWGPNEDRGLYKTVDGGKTWKQVLYVDDRTGVIDVIINPADPNLMLAATYCRMRDGFDGNDPMVKFGAGAGIWRSTDGGDNWQRMESGLPSTEMGRIGLCYYAKDPNFVYAVIESKKIGQMPDTTPFLGVRGESVDVGAKLTEITADSPAAKAELQVDDVVVRVNDKLILSYPDLLAEIRRFAAGDKVQLGVAREGKAVDVEVELALNPEIAKRLEGEKEKVEKKQDDDEATDEKAADEKSTATAEDKPEAVNAKLDELRRDSPFAQSLGGQNENLTDQQGADGKDFGGIYRSNDGGVTWTRINSLNPRPMYYSKIRVDPSDNNYIWVLGTSLYISEDGGETFSDNGAGSEVHVDHHAMWIDPSDGRHVILGCDGGVYVTYDRGKKWDHLNHIAIGQFYHVGVDSNRAYNVYGGLQDNGSWGGPSLVRNGAGPVNTDWFSVGGGDGFICLVDPTDPDQLYYESQNGAMGRVNLRTGERGGIRPRPPRGVRYRFNWKTPFILSPHNPEIHFSAGNYVFQSVKKGDNVQAISPEITRTDDGSGSAIGQSPLNENVLYVGTTDGMLWGTRNGGQSWADLWSKPEKAASDATSESSAGQQRGGAMGRGAMGRGGQARGGFGRGGRGRGMGGPVRGERPVAPAETATQPPASETASETATETASETASEPPTEEEATEEEATEEEATEEETTEEETTEEETTEEETTEEETTEEETTEEETTEEETTEEETTEEETTDEEQAVTDLLSGSWAGKFESEMMPAERSGFRMALQLGKDGKYAGQYETSQGGGNLDGGELNAESGAIAIAGSSSGVNVRIVATVKDRKLTGTFEVNDGAFSIPFSAERTGDATSLDGGQAAKPVEDNSKPLKELLPKQMWVSSIEPSKYEAGRCYVTIDGHRSDVDGPFVLVTENYGQTWTRLDGSLPAGTGSARVIREDIVNRNLLYLGTEFGLFASIDRGKTWTSMKGEFPTVAVHEVAQHPTAGEIVAGTHGRSLWIADVTALRQWSADSIAADVQLYKPATVIRWRSLPRAADSGTRRFVGENPSSDAQIYYSLASDVREIELEIRDITGRVLQRLEVPSSAGLHKVEWDLRRRTTGSSDSRRRRFAPRVENGEYLVALIVDGKVYNETLTIESDPEFTTSGRAENEAELLEELFSTSEEDN
ncbi:VPS10 domain-containing protein [Planctomycetaceae bacterium SH139]